MVCASLGASAYKTAVGRALSGPVCAMVCGALFATLGVLPAPGPHYAAIQTATVSIATPALLFGADLRAVLRAVLRGAWGAAAVGTTRGAAGRGGKTLRRALSPSSRRSRATATKPPSSRSATPR